MKNPEMIRWTLAWNNSRTNPPDGGPRVLIEQILPRGVRPEKIDKAHVLGSPYGVHFQTIEQAQPRQLSLEAKQRIRRKAVARRIEKAAPLFAASLLEQALTAHPEYFGRDIGTEPPPDPRTHEGSSL